MTLSPFDHNQDHELGEAMRAILSGQDDDAFVRRVLARTAEMHDGAAARTVWWAVLSGWARPGLVAAGFGLVLSVTIMLSGLLGNREPPLALGDPLQPMAETSLLSVLITANTPPDLNEVLELALGQ